MTTFAKAIFRAAFFCLLLSAFFSPVFSQPPDPRDSVIFESKATLPGAAVNGTDTAAMLYVRVWITNKDSLANFSLPVVIRSLSDNAFGIIGRPRTFDGTASRLTSTLGATLLFAGNRLNGTSPDSATWAGFFDPLDPATVEPPNSIRAPFWDLKFDTITVDSSQTGQFEIDSIRIMNVSVQFVDLLGGMIPVNFIKSVITVPFVDSFPTPVEGDGSNNFPRTYQLSQNYPNPFNSNTQILFSLPKSGKTTLEIFNILGQKVGTLINEYLAAGNKIVNWDGRDDRGAPVPSGIYLYQLRSGDFIQKKKMVYLK